MKNPIDLLPVHIPFSDPSPPDDYFFYENVVKKLIPNVLEMEQNGIPINLDKVKEIEKITDEVLTRVNEQCETNPILIEFMSKFKDDKFKSGYTFKKLEDFLTAFNRKNVIHRSFVVNKYLEEHNLEKDKLEEWKIKDIKKYAELNGSKFLQDLANNTLDSSDITRIDKYMIALAEYQSELYNNNVRERIEFKKDLIRFNPQSNTQKRALMQFLGLESESKTKKNADQWDRKNLIKLKEKLEEEIANAT